MQPPVKTSRPHLETCIIWQQGYESMEVLKISVTTETERREGAGELPRLGLLEMLQSGLLSCYLFCSKCWFPPGGLDWPCMSDTSHLLTPPSLELYQEECISRNVCTGVCDFYRARSKCNDNKKGIQVKTYRPGTFLAPLSGSTGSVTSQQSECQSEGEKEREKERKKEREGEGGKKLKERAGRQGLSRLCGVSFIV